jgi:L-alanine-DL-glutamate epimerase-like enolase superfamily enzyme
MKITDISVTLFSWKDLPAVTYGSHNPTIAGDSLLGLVTIQTDQGVDGHAFLGSSFRGADLDCNALVKMLKPLAMGQNPLDRERIWRAMMKRSRAVPLRPIGAIDIALWDIAGKVAGLPLHRLMGSYRDRLPVYGSSPTYQDLDPYVEEALRVKAAGWPAYKIHPPAGNHRHIRVCEAVREAVGEDYGLMLDSAMAYSYPEALQVGRALERLGYLWYEDPLPEDDMVTYVKLCAKLDIPVMATEYSPGGFHAYAPWLAMRATDYLRGDVAIKGGITAVLKAAHLAEAFRMNYELHHGGNSLNNVANLHVCMAIQNCDYFEILLPDAAQKYALVEDIEIDPEGYVHAFDKPGLGAEIDFDLIRRHTETVLR